MEKKFKNLYLVVCAAAVLLLACFLALWLGALGVPRPQYRFFISCVSVLCFGLAELG